LSKLAAIGSKAAKNFINHTMHLSVDPHLADLQLIALRTAAPYMMGVEIRIYNDPETGASLFTTTLITDGAQIHPSDLFDQIHEAQGEYAAGFPDQSVDWWPNYFVDVKAAPRHHSIRAKARMRKAA
jgi:hypothetical protein